MLVQYPFGVTSERFPSWRLAPGPRAH